MVSSQSVIIRTIRVIRGQKEYPTNAQIRDAPRLPFIVGFSCNCSHRLHVQWRGLLLGRLAPGFLHTGQLLLRGNPRWRRATAGKHLVEFWLRARWNLGAQPRLRHLTFIISKNGSAFDWLYGLAAIAIGLGSAFYHTSLSFAGQPVLAGGRG